MQRSKHNFIYLLQKHRRVLRGTKTRSQSCGIVEDAEEVPLAEDGESGVEKGPLVQVVLWPQIVNPSANNAE